jgi:hypothetical protein
MMLTPARPGESFADDEDVDTSKGNDNVDKVSL